MDDRGVTALHWSSSKGNFDIVKLLVEYGANLNLNGECGTALHWALDNFYALSEFFVVNVLITKK